MQEISFSEADVQAMGHDRYHHPEPCVQRHMEILWLKQHAANYNLSNEDIATLAGCSRSTVQRTLSAYTEGGLERIRQVTVKEPHSELDNHRGSLEEIFAKEPPRSVKHAQHVIFEHTGIQRGLTQV